MSFTAFKSEGGLLPQDMLEQIASGTTVGQRPLDFGLDKNRRLTDEIAAAWADARDLWRVYQRALERLREGDAGTTATRDQWLVPLLRVVGYDDLTYSSSAEVVEGKTYHISHWAGNSREGAPLQLVGSRVDLDSREAGRTRLSAGALVQEYLNRTEHLWGIVSNGLRIRVLRNSAKLTRPTYLEIDLEQIMLGEKFAEFSLLYRLLHRTRLSRGASDAAHCFLEQYYQEVLSVGGRVREKLRDGVEEALRQLGTGFLSHPRNDTLRQRLHSGALSEGDLYRQLLRLIYRFLFLMVAEERHLVGPDQQSPLWDLYYKYYSVSRLRNLAERHLMGAERHADLWRQLRATFALYCSEDQGRAMEVSPLDGDLFGSDTIPDLEPAELSNEHLLSAIRHLSLYRDEKVLRRVNYGALDVEELGSVYEGLLEYKPRVHHEGERFVFELVYGSDRRATGSYYTHPDLVHALIVHTLDPVIEERTARAKTPQEQVKGLLSITVCDPACGSGHFLLAAARRIGGEVARIRAGEDQVKPEDYRKAVRDAIQHCIYGVDVNPLAVDLCKVALWLEGLNKGRPLNFLDHRIRCGNSLIGCTPEMLQKSIPDEAYDAVPGDHKPVAKAFKKRNKEERERLEAGQLQLSFAQLAAGQEALASEFTQLDELGEDSTAEVHRKAESFDRARQPGTQWHRDWVACNLWTSAFFTPKDGYGAPVPTTETVVYFLAGLGAEHRVVQAANRTAEENQLFHWHLEFPEVMNQGGFDCIIGNPPFLNGRRISSLFGDSFLKFLKSRFDRTGATTDLCVYFFRQAFLLLRNGGGFGLIATKSISQGDAREAGLQAIVDDGGTITFAIPIMEWPGDANVKIALVALHKGDWTGRKLLGPTEVRYITPLLDEGEAATATPIRLRSNAKKAFIGSYVLGMGFTMEPGEAQALITGNPTYRDILFPFLVGEDVNSRWDQSASRWTINFGDRSLAEAEHYPDCLEIVRERVKPHRDTVKRLKYREQWWRYAEACPGLYSAIADQSRVLVTSLVTKHLCFTFVPNGWVYSHLLGVIAIQDDYHFAVLQSSFHEAWARRYGSSLGGTLRYTPTDCFETFAFPTHPIEATRNRLVRLGSDYITLRKDLLLERQIGLTKLYNGFHDPMVSDASMAKFRELHREMDCAVCEAYSWSDINLAHGFYGEGSETRFTISPEAKKEILRRLLALNLQRAAEDAKQN